MKPWSNEVMKGTACVQIIIWDITPYHNCSAEVALHQQLGPAAAQRAGGGPGDAAGQPLGDHQWESSSCCDAQLSSLVSASQYTGGKIATGGVALNIVLHHSHAVEKMYFVFSKGKRYFLQCSLILYPPHATSSMISSDAGDKLVRFYICSKHSNKSHEYHFNFNTGK